MIVIFCAAKNLFNLIQIVMNHKNAQTCIVSIFQTFSVSNTNNLLHREHSLEVAEGQGHDFLSSSCQTLAMTLTTAVRK